MTPLSMLTFGLLACDGSGDDSGLDSAGGDPTTTETPAPAELLWIPLPDQGTARLLLARLGADFAWPTDDELDVGLLAREPGADWSFSGEVYRPEVHRALLTVGHAYPDSEATELEFAVEEGRASEEEDCANGDCWTATGSPQEPWAGQVNLELEWGAVLAEDQGYCLAGETLEACLERWLGEAATAYCEAWGLIDDGECQEMKRVLDAHPFGADGIRSFEDDPGCGGRTDLEGDVRLAGEPLLQHAGAALEVFFHQVHHAVRRDGTPPDCDGRIDLEGEAYAFARLQAGDTMLEDDDEGAEWADLSVEGFADGMAQLFAACGPAPTEDQVTRVGAYLDEWKAWGTKRGAETSPIDEVAAVWGYEP